MSKHVLSNVAPIAGHGIVVESHMGHVTLTDNTVTGNHGNGIKVKFLDGRYVILDKQLTFCEIPDLASQTYPLLIYGVPIYGTSCGSVRISSAWDF